MRLRIAIWSNFYKPIISGVVTSIALFRQGLIEKRHDVHIFAPEVEDYEDDEPYIYRLPSLIDLTESHEFALALPLKGLMKQTMRGIKPHLIHSQHPVWVGDLALKYAQELRLPLVFTFHTRYEEYLTHYLPLISEWAGQLAHDVVQNYLEQCTHIIAPTPSIQKMLYEAYAFGAPVTVVPTPVDLTQYAHLEPAPIRDRHQLADKKVLLYLGRLSQEKNLDLLLRAFARLAAREEQVALMIVGRGPHTEALRELVDSLHIGDRVVFAGAVPHDQVPHYMAAADLFVFPSVYETQGVVLLEALAAGTPAVAVHGLGSDDILAGTCAGVLVREDEEAFADAIGAILSDPDRLAAMSRAALEVAQGYTVSAAADRLLAVYEQTIASGVYPEKHSLFAAR